MSRNQAYWLCQLVGWTLYGFFLGAIYVLNDIYLGGWEIASIGILCAFGLLYTHLFRALIKRRGWAQLAPRKLIPQVVLANIVMSVLFMGSVYTVDRTLSVDGRPEVDLSVIYIWLMNFTFIFFLWSLMYFAAYFFRNYKKKQIAELEWQGAIREFELNKLKSQLNPHFMFNALNTIRALVNEDPDKAQQSITQLSNILRNSLIASRRRTITLEEEMRTVHDYLNLEKLRYEERLSVCIDIDPAALPVQLPPMMLQTLVENAVKHGISRQTHGGFIRIEGKIIDRRLVVNIRNSGVLGKLETNGFGILNTRQRLELIYGTPHRFQISQETSDTVNAHLQIPAS